jgi:HK97 family phage portal protein
MNIIQKLFQRPQRERQAVIEINNAFSSFSGTAYGNATFRAAVDSIARHVGKLTAHGDNAAYCALLSNSPNPYMGGYDLLYKTATAYFTQNNAFILLDRAESGLRNCYPLTPSSVEFIGDPSRAGSNDGGLYAQMRFSDGREVLFPYGDIIHLRRHYYGNDLLGESNAPLFPLLDTAGTLNQGIAASVKNGTSIRGVLKFTSLVNPAQVKAEKAQFIADYFHPGNSGGLAATDQRFDFVPTNITPYNIPQEQITAVNAQIYGYLGVSPKIVSGEYSEDDFSAFYESVIEPFALQLSQEFSRKAGADITFTAERLEFSSAATKIKLLHEAAPLGLMTINEARKLLALPAVPDGYKRLISLNYIDAAKANQYQLESEEKANDTANTGV